MADEGRTELIKRWQIKGMDRCGEGFARFYGKDDTIYFGSFSLAPMAVGGIDKGHPRGEYFLCTEGRFVLILHHADKEKEYLEVEAGDAIFVPKNVDHQLINDSDKKMQATFTILL
ncbi:MAG: cupin domain-containing protein [Actinobacteria bacterium]|nr:cupin domain-containing protein [Actinomycetota bacterium]